MRYIFTFFLVICGQYFVLAQQTALFPEYNYNPFIINPAYAGMALGPEASLSHYGYINSVEGSPKSYALSFHSPVSRGKMGLGAAFTRDKIGVTTNTTAFAAYSYKLFFDHKSDRPDWQVYDQHVLSFGLTAGVHQLQENLLELGITDDPEFSENINATIPMVGVGFLYNRSNFYVGISAPNILGDKLASRDDLHLSNPVYGYMGYRFFANRFNKIMIKPSVLLKYEDQAPMQVDVNITTSFSNKFEIGAGYRSSSSLNFLAGIYLFRHFRLIYHYNAGLKNSLLGNSHGMILSYSFDSGYF
ncbi:PorP/SprF family type IX secretion system membrane protein [Sinomicrobium sp. FJxs]|uniref:PorP/SprF family type IX secretion system membrane protein n=2 Tax=Sinomicrobium weinanense TaxID=2842200 RepID=A0A926Q5J7_9FLAO|nr:PorP/SprF family type IX secretion system membrane protein [Sinomicrobium weinanense]MBU3125328.1 PorP/SprF family type IX secretion system membrane protein [Sinomicrobium weinanense]